MSKRKAPKGEDTSPYVYQRSKLSKPINLKEIPWTPKQKEFFSLVENSKTRILLVKGPAGTSKTMTAVYSALKLLNKQRISDIIYIRSAVESSDSKLGYLPGDVDEKLMFYNLPFYDKLNEMVAKEDIIKLQKEQRITAYPVNYSRGMNWNAKAIIMDEAQNSSKKEIITVLTRLGHYSRCFILADPMQTDLSNGRVGGFETLYELFDNPESRDMGIYTFEFDEDDILRSELVKFVVKKCNTLINNNN